MSILEALTSGTIEKYQSDIVNWYETNGRKFPWRQTLDPFRIIVAEIVLKLTGAWKGERAYIQLMQKYGTPELMAEANPNEIRDTFKPLGLQSRADLLIRVAQQITREFNGTVPKTYEELIGLEGIGPYIANAVLCLAYGARVPLVDGSVLRVFKRCFGYSTNKQAYANKQAWMLAAEILPARQYREYNLGILDIGALVCRHHKPKCGKCPISWVCAERGKIDANAGGAEDIEHK